MKTGESKSWLERRREARREKAGRTGDTPERQAERSATRGKGDVPSVQDAASDAGVIGNSAGGGIGG